MTGDTGFIDEDDEIDQKVEDINAQLGEINA